MRILAIDPGYERLGIAVVEKVEKEEDTLLHCECFRTSAKLAHHKRLQLIGAKIKEVIASFSPNTLAIENLFLHSNQKTAMKVAEARGVILYVASAEGLPVYEYTPLQVKIAVTGHGTSDKKQVMAMVPHLVSIPPGTRAQDDIYDAIAVGLTCAALRRAPAPRRKVER